MKTFVKLLTLMLAVLALASCATIPVYTYQSIDTDTKEMGSSSIIKSTDTMDVAVYAFDVENESKDDAFMFVFQNKTSQPLDLSKTRINFFEGNAFENNWEFSNTWNPDSYYENAKAGVAFDNAVALIDLGCVLLDDDSDKFDAYVSASYAADTIVSGSKALENIQTTSLRYNQMIPANLAVSGMAWFPVNDRKPDVKFEVGDLSFVFGKSDREQIINPWLDKTRDALAINVFYGLDGRQRFGLNVFYCTQTLGYYGGFSAQNVFDDHVANYTFKEGLFKRDNGVYEVHPSIKQYWKYDETYGVASGVTYKVMPYTWLCVGIETGSVSSFYDGTIQYRIKTDDTTAPWTTETGVTAFGDFKEFYVRPQLGATFICNHINLAVMASYDVECDTKIKGRRNAFCLDLGLGFAF